MSKASYYFVDGYNVINSWTELKILKDENLENARYKLIDMVRDFAAYEGVKVSVIFDAHYVKGSIEKHDYVGSIEVVYTKEGESADCYIERTVARISRKYDVSVVTFDYLEQRVVLQMGGIRITPDEFHEDINNAIRKIRERTKIKISKKKDTLESHLDKNTLEKLEKIRRSL